MSLRLRCLVLALVVGCGGAQSETTNEPQTAKDKQRREAKAAGELDKPNSNKWSGWRYQGDRKECFYVVGRHCYRTEKAACHAACKSPKLCETVGGGPASVSCKKS